MNEVIAIVGGTIIDGNGGKPIENGHILIEGQRIIAIESGEVPLPAHAKKISAAGKYVIPGLMDANVHLVMDHYPLTIVRYEGRYDELAVEAAQVALKSGVTTVFDTWGPREYLVKARDAINTGHVAGARMYIAGNIVGLGGPFSSDFVPAEKTSLFEEFTGRVNSVWQENVGPELVWMSPDQVRTEIRKYARSGIDFLKYAVTTHRAPSEHIMFSPRVQQVIVDEAHEAGLTVQTHTTTNEGIHLALELGVDLMQHVDLTHGPQTIPQETIIYMAARGVPGALLAQTDNALATFRELGKRTPFFKLYETTIDVNTRALIRSGATLLLSTDAGLFCSDTMNSAWYREGVVQDETLLKLGEGHFHWLLAVSQKGMKPMDALMAATRNIARAYRVDRDLGTLEVGKIADLLVLDKNPLEHAANYRSINMVMKEGRIVDRQSLPSRRLITSAVGLCR